MSYTELYLDYLNNKESYQELYENLAFSVFIQEVSPAQLRNLIGKEQDYLNKLVQQKARFADNPQVAAAIDAKIKATGATLGKLQTKLKSSPEAGGMPDQPAGAPTQADIPAAPVPPETPTMSLAQAKQQKATADTISQRPKTSDVAKPDTGTPQDYGAVGTTPPPPVPQDLSLTQQIGQGVDKAKELAGQGVDKAKELGGQVMDKAKDIAGAPSQPLPTGMAGPPAPGTGLAGGAETGLQSVGVSPDVAGGVGSAIQAVGASPLGLAALGGAAAYGGYKLYKRFLSKSATACRGYSGADKTACMKSYMDAKRNQAQTRGAEAGQQ
jgi:hypothetical protein